MCAISRLARAAFATLGIVIVSALTLNLAAAETSLSAASTLATVTHVSAQSTNDSVILSWDPVADADNYTIHYGTVPAAQADYMLIKPVGAVTTQTLHLSAGTYYFAVTAENTNKKIGSGFYSTEVSAVVAAAVTTPAAETPHSAASAVPEDLPQSGPEVLVFAFAITAGVYVLRRLKQ